MKRVLVLLGFWIVLANVEAAPPANQNSHGPASSSGADLAQGTWGGILTLPDGTERQINLYFNATTQDPQDPAHSKASGYFSQDDVGGKKRAKAPALPMMAGFTQLGEGTFDVVILATIQIPSDEDSETIVMRLDGEAVLRGSALRNDLMGGEWSAMGYEGSWSARHLDPRRNMNAPTVDLGGPALWFGADVYANLEGPAPATSASPDTRARWTCLGAAGNMVMDRVRVTRPDGTTVVVPPYTDVFSPGVDWATAFRFSIWLPGLPVAGGRYVFTGLDVAGRPIPGVVASDVWVGVQPPEPPTDVWAGVHEYGILIDWDAVPVVPGSFDPEEGIGFYQLELSDCLTGAMVYGANGIGTPSHLIPRYREGFAPGVDWGLSLDELPNGLYSLRTSVVSVAPAGSAGHGIEYHNADSITQTLWIQIAGNLVVAGP